MWLYLLLLLFLLGCTVLLYAPLPMDIADRRKLQFMEFILRISNEYLGDLVERCFGPRIRNCFTRFLMGIGFVIPLPPPSTVKVRNETIRGVRVRLYEPKKKRGKGALVFIHGGGWATMRPDYYDNVLFWFAERVGVTSFSIDYRLAPEHPFPAGLDDCVAAIEGIHEKCQEFDIDGQKIAVCGDSAGGNLSAVIAQKLKDEKYICCQVLIYPVISVFSFLLPSYQDYYKKFRDTALLNPKSMARWILFYLGLEANINQVKKLLRNRHVSRELKSSPNWKKILNVNRLPSEFREEHNSQEGEEDPQLSETFEKVATNPAISPIFGVTGDLPPALVLTAGYDVLRDEGILYARRLQEAGVSTKWSHYPTAFHGVFNMPYSAIRHEMSTEIAVFLENHLLPNPFE